jgi:hypothetical protein
MNLTNDRGLYEDCSIANLSFNKALSALKWDCRAGVKIFTRSVRFNNDWAQADKMGWIIDLISIWFSEQRAYV